MKNISSSRVALFTMVALILFLVLLEAVAMLAGPLYLEESRKAAIFTSDYDDHKEVNIKALDKHEVAPSVTVNITGNFLTSPDEDLIFHVSRNPDHKVIRNYTRINAEGYRGDDFTAELLTDNSRKILIIGDSCAFGWGMPDFSQTWQAQLEETLGSEQEPYRVFNLGQPGYSSYQGRLVFDRWFDKISPKTLVIYFGWNDIWSTPLLTDRQTITMMKISNHTLIDWVFDTNTYDLLRWIMQQGVSAIGGGMKAGYDGQGKIRVPPSETIDNFEYFISRAEKAGTKVIIIGPPFVNKEYHRAYLMPGYVRKLYDTFSQRALFVRLAPMQHQSPNASEYFLGDGFHPNYRGNKLIAIELADLITGKSGGATVADFNRQKETIPAVHLAKLTGVDDDDHTSLGWTGMVRGAIAGEHAPGTLVYGPYRNYSVGGDYEVRFRIKVNRLTDGPLLTLDVVGDEGNIKFAERHLSGADFPTLGEWVEFTLPFTVPAGGVKKFETRVFYRGGGDLWVDYISIDMPINPYGKI